LHDIGDMRGVLSGDTETEFVVDASERKCRPAASDASCRPITSIDRSCLRLSAWESHRSRIAYRGRN
jgi:hypothetical protein